MTETRIKAEIAIGKEKIKEYQERIEKIKTKNVIFTETLKQQKENETT